MSISKAEQVLLRFIPGYGSCDPGSFLLAYLSRILVTSWKKLDFLLKIWYY